MSRGLRIYWKLREWENFAAMDNREPESLLATRASPPGDLTRDVKQCRHRVTHDRHYQCITCKLFERVPACPYVLHYATPTKHQQFFSQSHRYRIVVTVLQASPLDFLASWSRGASRPLVCVTLFVPLVFALVLGVAVLVFTSLFCHVCRHTEYNSSVLSI